MKNLIPQFDFDDILIVPKVNTDITSRYKDIILPKELPLFTAPMDTVVNLDNMDNFLAGGINVTLPRTITYKQFIDIACFDLDCDKVYKDVFVSLGFQDIVKFFENNYKFRNFHGGAHILIDVANGHMQKVMDYATEIKRLRPDIKIMVGNIANPEAYWWYAENDCVDYIRVGIGNGNGCLTTKQSGVGYPMASLIRETYLVKQNFIEHNNIDIKHQNSIIHTKPVKVIPQIVADGGMKDYSDVIKALALGADYVMVGSIFNKALESCAKNYFCGIPVNKKIANYLFDRGFTIKKQFRGMSTKNAQKAMGKTVFKTSEGVTRVRKVEYHLSGWIENFEHYLRNAMSYSGAKTLQEFIGNSEICQITKNAYDRFNK